MRISVILELPDKFPGFLFAGAFAGLLPFSHNQPVYCHSQYNAADKVQHYMLFDEENRQ
jgi:hypothetical protein